MLHVLYFTLISLSEITNTTMSCVRNKERIPKRHSEVLRKNHVYLLKNVQSCVMKGIMFAKGILDKHEMDSIAAHEREGVVEGMERLLHYLHYSGPSGFSKFKDCLRDAGYSVDKLEETENDDLPHCGSIAVCLDMIRPSDDNISLVCVFGGNMFIVSPYLTIGNTECVEFHFSSSDQPIQVQHHVIKCSKINICIHQIHRNPCTPVEDGPTILHLEVDGDKHLYKAICWDCTDNEYIFYTSVDLSRYTSSSITLVFDDGINITSFNTERCECGGMCYRVYISTENTLLTYKQWKGRDTRSKKTDSIHFKPFHAFVKEDVQWNDLVFEFIKQHGQRVVLVEYIERGSLQVLHMCSGMVFRTRNTFYLQTNNMHHLVNKVKCYVTFNFDDDSSDKNKQLVDMSGHFMGACFHQDKAIYTLETVPSSNFHNIPDISPIVVNIESKECSLLAPGLVEYVKALGKYVIHAYVDSNTHFSDFKVIFSDSSSTNCIHILKCHQNHCSQLHVDQELVPSDIKDMFNQMFSWESTGSHNVVAIFHPYGEAKLISFGKSTDFIYQEHNNTINVPSYDGVTFLNHTAATCSGSRGGCVLLLSDEHVKDKIGYNSRICMHHGNTKGTTMSSIGIIDGIDTAMTSPRIRTRCVYLSP